VKSKIVIIFIFLLCERVSSQDPQFSQFYSNPLYLAPSFAGAAEASRVAASYRYQWWNLPVNFTTYSFSYDHYFSSYNSGIGFLGYRDVAGSGDLGLLSLGIQYSYNFQLFRFLQIRPGLHFSYLEHGVAFNELIFIDQVMANPIDPGNSGTTFDPSLERTRDVDFASSLLIYSKKVWIGTTVDHLLMPNYSLYADKYRIPMRYTVFGGVELIRKGKLINPIDETMTFAYMLRHQGSNTQLDLGVYWHRNPLVFGLWYRGIPPTNSQRGDAIIFLFGYKTRSFNIGYSYDLTVSNLITHAIGSHEITMTAKLLLPRRKKIGSVPCPEF
jgi:type IX secretion system PorP/SprF family membrane protein